MKTFRKIWLIAVLIVSAIFGAYKIYIMKTEDYSRPVFTCEEDTLHIGVEDGEDVLLNGITASDEKDGDVTDSILVEKLTDIYDDNKRLVTYIAFDADNHISSMEREIVYTDYSSPRFKLTGSLRFRAGETIDLDAIVKAEDCLDGDISRQIKIKKETTINNRTPGLYPVEFQVTNSAGDTVRLPVEIEVYQPDTTQMELNLTDYLIYYEGGKINYSSYLKSVTDGSSEYYFEGTEDDHDTAEQTPLSRQWVTIDSKVDTKTPGVYPVYFYYRYDEDEGTCKAMEMMYVVVE